MTQELTEMPLDAELPQEDETPEIVPVPRSLVGHLNETAVLLDIDGTLLDFAPTPREVWVPPGRGALIVCCSGQWALALVSGRSPTTST
jgi:trehalose 6-phosphate phosphatase